MKKYRTPIEDTLLREMVEEDRVTIYIDAMDDSYDAIAPDPVKGLFDDDSSVNIMDTVPDDIFESYPDDFNLT